MEPIIQQIKELAHSSNDPDTHKEILDSLRDLSFSLENPGDTVQRMMYSALQTAVARIANDVKLFEILIAQKAPMDAAELAQKTGVAPLLMSRLIRYAATVGMARELADGTYTPTNLSANLQKPGIKAGINFSVDIMIPCMQALPELLADTKYNDITEPTNTAFQRGLHTNDTPFAYLQKNPQKFGDFALYMTASQEGLSTWLDVYPLLEDINDFDSKKPLFVDIGSGIGDQCLALKTKYPEFDQPGRLVIQDLGPIIEHAIPMENVTAMEYNFFTPQPVKAAKFYYMRNILHSYRDDVCRVILKQITSAMGKDSVILINEIALSDVGVHWQASQLDLLMMMSFGAMERTVTQWHKLLESGGLRIVKIHTITRFLQDSIIVAVAA